MDSRKLEKTRGKRKGKKHEEKRKGKKQKGEFRDERETRNHRYITYELPSFFMNLARESMDS